MRKSQGGWGPPPLLRCAGKRQEGECLRAQESGRERLGKPELREPRLRREGRDFEIDDQRLKRFPSWVLQSLILTEFFKCTVDPLPCEAHFSYLHVADLSNYMKVIFFFLLREGFHWERKGKQGTEREPGDRTVCAGSSEFLLHL